MREELRKVPFECRACWHVWEEEYTIKFGDRGEVWLRGNVPVPPPDAGREVPEVRLLPGGPVPRGLPGPPPGADQGHAARRLRRHPAHQPGAETPALA
ncbi:hypothetical protein ACFSTC_16545 [Nonomuraea ferruginea]